jgi:hypothetical protein
MLLDPDTVSCFTIQPSDLEAGMALKTIKQVSDLTGISIRMLRYYDKIGLLEPSSTTEAGYTQRSDELMRELTSDIDKDPSSPEIQLIVKGMDDLTKETARIARMDMGEGYWGLMADLYLTKPSFLKVHDKKYGDGATRFLGEALKAYSDPNREQNALRE